MSEPFLIAHVVRGESAFDIAEKVMIGDKEGWIVSTSGHLAHPYWSVKLRDVILRINTPNGEDAITSLSFNGYTWTDIDDVPSNPPEGWPDHFAVNTRPPTTAKVEQFSAEALLKDLGL